MFCSVMFSILEYLIYSVSEWCSVRVSTSVKCWILFIIIFLSYMAILLMLQFCLWLCGYFKDSVFNELYQATKNNDVVRAINILNKHPTYVNKFKYPDGYTPFMMACSTANTQMVKFMLRMGADMTLRSKSGETPFYLTAFYYIQNKNYKNASCLRELYYAGANIDEPGKNNVTPLQMAAAFGHTSLVKWLLVKNANIKTCPHPYLLAKSQGHHEAANLIAATMQLKCIQYK